MLRWTSDREGSSLVRRQAAEVFLLGVKFEPFTGGSLGFLSVEWVKASF